MSRCIDCTWLCELAHVMDHSPRESREDVNFVKKNPTTNTNNKRIEVEVNDGSSIKMAAASSAVYRIRRRKVMWAVEWDQRYEAPMASSVAATGASLQVFSTLSVSMIHYLVSSRTTVEPRRLHYLLPIPHTPRPNTNEIMYSTRAQTYCLGFEVSLRRQIPEHLLHDVLTLKQIDKP